MVPHYLVSEGISLLGFLYVYIDNEDIYSYTNRKKAAREQSVCTAMLFQCTATLLDTCKVLQRRAGEEGSHSSNYWCQGGMKFLNCPAVGQRLKRLDYTKAWQQMLKKHRNFHTVGLWLPPWFSWTITGFVWERDGQIWYDSHSAYGTHHISS